MEQFQMAFCFLMALTFSFCTAFGTKKHVHIRIHVPEIIQKVNHEKIIYKHIKKYKHDEKHYDHFGKDVGGGYQYGHLDGGESSGDLSGKHIVSLGRYHHFGSLSNSVPTHNFETSETSGHGHQFGSSGGSSYGLQFGSSGGSGQGVQSGSSGGSGQGHQFGSSGGSIYGHQFGSSGGSIHGHQFGSSGGSIHGNQFGSSGGSSQDHQFGSSRSSSHGQQFGSYGSSGHSEHFGDLTEHHAVFDSGLDTRHGGLGSFGYDHKGSIGSSNEFSEFSSGLSSYGGNQSGSSESGHSNGKSLGSSIVTVGHFNFNEYPSEGNNHGWKGLK